MGLLPVPAADPLNAPVGRPRRWRDRLLESPRFQRWAARFPLTRPIARRRARELFDLVAGFAYSQVLMSCLQLGLLERLRGGPATDDTLSRQTELPLPALRQLLQAAAALRLVEQDRRKRWRLGDLGAALLGNPGARAMVAHHGALYADLADPVALLRRRGETRLAGFWPYATGSGREASRDAVEPYSNLMATSQAMLVEDLLDVLPLARCDRLLDIAGGDGHFAAAALARWPRLHATLFDLPPVVDLAAERRAAECAAGRLTLAAGNMLTDPLPAGADLATLVRVLHDHDDQAAMTLLRAAACALPAGGTLAVAEPMAGTRGAEGVGAYFSMYLWAMGSGRPRSADEIGDMLRSAGFERVRELSTPQPLLLRVLTARRSVSFN